MKVTSRFLLRKVFFLSALFFLSLMLSCKKDGKLTPDFENEGFAVNFTDTFTVNTRVIQEDSLRTDLSIYHLLGYYNDYIFGPAASSIYTQIHLTGANVDFGTAPIIDSVVLSLGIVSYYGDGLPMNINVYKLNEDMYADTNYYSTSQLAREVTTIGQGVYTPNINDNVSVISNGDTLSEEPQVRIKLSNAFGQDILNNAPYTDNSTFTSLFKGLYISVDDSVTTPIVGKKRGTIAYFDLNSAVSRVSVYYHYGFSLEPSQYNFNLAEAEKFSHFEHNYSGTDIEAHLSDLPTKDTTVTYVSTMAGVKTKVDIPNIKDLTNTGISAINKAELIFTVENGTESDIDNALSNLSLVSIDENGNSQFILDFFEGTDHYGGFIVDNGTHKTYTFNITRHVHNLVYNTTTDYGMYLVANSSTTTANRTVISSENSANYKIKLEITYSKL